MTPAALLIEPRPAAAPETPQAKIHTVWGLDPLQLHSRFWASRGVQVARQGEPSEIVKHAELFLLTDRRTMAIFRLADLMEQLSWLDVDLLFVRISDSRDRGYKEVVVTDRRGGFLRLRRLYGQSGQHVARIALTPHKEIAQIWQAAPSAAVGWNRLRRAVPRNDRWTVPTSGRLYDRDSDREQARFVRDLVESWRRPDSTINGLRRVAPGVWADRSAVIDPGATFTGRAWIGAGRVIGDGVNVVGPSVLWDTPEARPVPEDIRWLDLEPTAPPLDPRPRQTAPSARFAKRVFDILFALAALAATLPLYPIIALAILIEDGGPIFFAHRRETIGGRQFPCIKFRSMRKDAERIKAELKARNQADGPQFFIENDPRLTRVGAKLRKYQLDELPQFINVLLGHMSVVGPRPSPYEENQYCPAWREARLSVRPGVTGLWQIKRTRAAGSDFQEWIKYDIEYVERCSFWLDLVLIWKTILMVARGVARS